VADVEQADLAQLRAREAVRRERVDPALPDAGGLGILAADACDSAGLVLPDLAEETRARLSDLLPREASIANPVDMLGSAVGETYERAIPILLADPAIDALVVVFVLTIVADTEDVCAAILQRAAARMRGPVVVQPFLKGQTELLAGVVQDPVFGPLVAFGPGGTLAELIGAARFALAPLTDVDVDIALTTGKAATLLDGWRGAPPADRAEVAGVLHRLSRLAVDVPEVAELDLNPVLAGPTGAVTVDARVRLRRVEQSTSAKTW
jgi:acyl-CoA synthetase (NDP forming)